MFCIAGMQGSVSALPDALDIAEAMLAGGSRPPADLDRESTKSLVYKLATSLASNDKVYGIAAFANSGG